MADYSGILMIVITTASSDRCQWVQRTMKALLLSFAAVETTEVVLHEISRETDGVFLSATAKLQFVCNSDSTPGAHNNFTYNSTPTQLYVFWVSNRHMISAQATYLHMNEQMKPTNK